MHMRALSMAAAVTIVALTWLIVAYQPRALLAQMTGPTPGPYARQQNSSVPGLTEAEIDDLRNGRGMGLARSAELNGYPGPRHVLDLADELALTDEQRRALQALFEQMKDETIPRGEHLLAQHASLGQAFRDGSITVESLHERTAAIGQSEGGLRAAHLKYHLLTKPLMTDEQIARYNHLRGYGASGEPQPSPDHHAPGRHGR